MRQVRSYICRPSVYINICISYTVYASRMYFFPNINMTVKFSYKEVN
jgi:hypothetical protein